MIEVLEKVMEALVKARRYSDKTTVIFELQMIYIGLEPLLRTNKTNLRSPKITRKDAQSMVGLLCFSN